MPFSLRYFYMGVVVPAAIVLPLGIALRSYKQLSGALKWFTASLAVSGITNVVVKLYSMNAANNMPVFHTYTIIEFLLLSMFYRQLFKGNVLYRIIPVTAIVYTLFCIVNIMLWQPLSKYNSYSRSVEAIIVIIYSIAYFKCMLDEQLSVTQQKTVNWLNSGLLLYFSGSLFLFICGNFILSNVALNAAIWNIHASLVLLMYILFTIGLGYAKRA